MGNPRVLSVGKAWLRSWMGRTQWESVGEGTHVKRPGKPHVNGVRGKDGNFRGKTMGISMGKRGNVHGKFWWESLVIFMGKFRGDLMFISNELGEERRERVRRATFVVAFVYVTHVQC